jgi:hypothetical protein
MPDSVLRHVVLFGFKATSSPQDVDGIVAAFKHFLQKSLKSKALNGESTLARKDSTKA